MKHTLAVLTGLLLLAAQISTADAALTWTFTKIADTDSAIPNGIGDFTGFDRPGISGENVVFRGFGSSSQSGVYKTTNGTLSRVASEFLGIPNGTGNFIAFGSRPDISGENVVFYGLGNSSQDGVYTQINGTLSHLADESTAVPDGSGNFTTFGSEPSISGENVAFRGTDAAGDRGIYVRINGVLSEVADVNTSVPNGTGNFLSLDIGPAISGENLAFRGNGNNQDGIYSHISSTLSRVADQNTSVPDNSGNFSSFGRSPSISGENVAFRSFATGQGTYAQIDGTLLTIADQNTAIPNGIGNFTAMGLYPSVSGDIVAFLGGGSGGQSGIYLHDGTMLHEVISENTLLDGKTPSSFGFSDALDGLNIAFTANFTDGSEGVFIATIPEPSRALFIALGAVSIFSRRKRS